VNRLNGSVTCVGCDATPADASLNNSGKRQRIMNTDARWTGPDPAALRLPPADVVEHVTEVCGDLKEELVAYGHSPRYSKHVNAAFRKAIDSRGGFDEGAAMLAFDALLLQTKLHDGTTIVQRFAEQRRPPFSDEQKAFLLGWRGVVEGLFEIRERLDGGGLLLHNLLDDLLYPTWANMGPAATEPMTPGSFLVTRVVPAHTEYDLWLFSGSQSQFGPETGPVMAQTAMQAGMTNSHAMRRNSVLVAMAWESQAEDRAAFLEVAGTDLLVGTPQVAREVLLEHRRLRQRKIEQGRPAADADLPAGPSPEDLVGFPEDLMECDSVAVVYDEIEGMHFFAEFAAATKPFTVPADQLVDTVLTQLRIFLNDDSVPPFLIRRLAAQHPDTVDQVFAKLLGKRGFSWTRDGEALLARKKPGFADREPAPSVTVTGTRLAELLRTGA
jgi:hypothetical protein